MDNKTTKKRSEWSSSFGFIMASVGAAVGLGNIWGFPYKLGQGGGFVFLFLYLIFVFVTGFPILLAELSIGRASRRSPLLAYKSISKKLAFVGYFNLAACFLILCYYGFFGGMVLESFFSCLGISINSPVLWHFIFLALTSAVVIIGVEKGIEKCSAFMVPALLILLLFIAFCTLRLPGASGALTFLFKPDFSKLNLNTAASALTQVFFSLSLGQGCMITYGSYLRPGEKLLKSAALIPVFDTLVALLAALAVMPAVFSFGVPPSLGPAMMFEVVPMVFSDLPGGTFLTALFFLLIFFAAITSSVSMLETLVSSATERPGVKRYNAIMEITLLCALGGLPVCYGYGVSFGWLKLDFFGYYEFISQNIIITFCALITCFAVVYIWKPDKALPATLGAHPGIVGRLWIILLKCITPALLLSVLLSSLFV